MKLIDISTGQYVIYL